MSITCRVCGSSSIQEAGEVEYFPGYAWKVHDCDTCGCRFTAHDNSVYELLHTSGAISYYGDYRDLATESKRLFELRDLDGLRDYLSGFSKYRFVINAISKEPREARLLEVGCSRGYLTSWSILDGRKILGIDVSSEAVAGARQAFGDYFVLPSSSAIQAGAPYDLIYHVGMIGCVADPLGLTKDLLGLLKPGGKLLFNAPNRESCSLQAQLWIDSAPPPDLVTLFPPGFWKQQFKHLAAVTEEVEMCPAEKSLQIGLRKIFGVRWKRPVPQLLAPQAKTPKSRVQAINSAWSYFERTVLKAGRLTGFSAFAPKQPSEFGLFVSMTRSLR